MAPTNNRRYYILVIESLTHTSYDITYCPYKKILDLIWLETTPIVELMQVNRTTYPNID